jgi:hypothetical protein
MYKRIRNFLAQRKGFLRFMALNYFDKATVFAGPLLVPFLLHDKVLYNQIEYAYAVAPLLAVVLDAGVRTYFLQAYRESEDRSALVAEVGRYFHLLLLIYTLVAIVAVALAGAFNLGIAIVVSCSIRSLFLLAQGFFQRYYRLLDLPSKAFAFSLSGGVATMLIVAVFWLLGSVLQTWQFFAAQALVTLLACVIGLRLVVAGTDWRRFLSYLRQSLVYGWPVMVNVLAMSFLNNIGKIYAFSALPAEDMFRLSLIQRIALIVQLTHVGMIGYLEKNLFLSESPVRLTRIFLAYASLLGAATVGALALLWALPHISPVNPGPIDMVAGALLVSTILWCAVSYGEMLMMKYQIQKLIPIFSLSGFAVSAGCLYSGRAVNLNGVVLATFIGVVVNFLLMFATIMLLRRKRPVPC